MTTRRTILLALAALLVAAESTHAQAPKAEKKPASDADGIIAQEKAIYDALAKNDFPAFNKAIGADFIFQSDGGTVAWELSKSAEMLKNCKTGKWTLSDTKVTPVGSDVRVLTYKAVGEQTCDGKKSPSPIFAMSVWHKQGGRWVATAHSEMAAAPGK